MKYFSGAVIRPFTVSTLWDIVVFCSVTYRGVVIVGVEHMTRLTVSFVYAGALQDASLVSVFTLTTMFGHVANFVLANNRESTISAAVHGWL